MRHRIGLPACMMLSAIACVVAPARAGTQGAIAGWGDQVVGVDLSGGFTAIAAGGGISSGDYSLALKADGSVVAWGDNSKGQCNVRSPNSGFVAIAAGYAHSLGLKADGSVVAWGYNSNGQCNVPTPNSGFVGIAAGGNHSLAIRGYVGDVNGDGSVDVVDLLYFADAFGAVSGDLNYSPDCDFNTDGSVDVVDLLILAGNFGK